MKHRHYGHHESHHSKGKGKHHGSHAHHHGGHKTPHVGPIKHADMVMYHGSDGHGTEDPLASEEHCEANKEFGMPAGNSPKGGYHMHHERGQTGHSQHGGEGMAHNISYE